MALAFRGTNTCIYCCVRTRSSLPPSLSLSTSLPLYFSFTHAHTHTILPTPQYLPIGSASARRLGAHHRAEADGRKGPRGNRGGLLPQAAHASEALRRDSAVFPTRQQQWRRWWRRRRREVFASSPGTESEIAFLFITTLTSAAFQPTGRACTKSCLDGQ